MADGTAGGGRAIAYSVRENAYQLEAEWRLESGVLSRTGGGPAEMTVTLRALRILIWVLAPWLAPFILRPVDKGEPLRLPLADLRAIRLTYDPTRFDTARYRCAMRFRGRRRKLVMQSTHYVKIGSFESRSATYTPFVRALVAAAAAANPAVALRSGKSPLHYWAEHAILAVLFGALIYVLFAFATQTGISASSEVKIGLILAMMPIMVLYTKRNWPRRFTPDAIPPDILPESRPRED